MPAQPLVAKLAGVGVVPGDRHDLALHVARDRHGRYALKRIPSSHDQPEATVVTLKLAPSGPSGVGAALS